MSKPLDVKRWILASIAVFIVYSIIEYLSNQFVFMPSSGMLSPAGSEGESVTLARVWMYLGRAVFAIMFVFIYTRGHEGKPGIGEGIRYGLWVALLVPVPLFFRNLVVSGSSANLLFTGMALSFIEIVLFGILTNLIYNAPAQKAAA